MTREGLVPPPGGEVTGWYSVLPRRNSPGVGGHRIHDLPEFDAALISHAGGRSVWRDGRIEPAPALGYDAVGDHIFVSRFGGRVFLDSLAGFFELDRDMTVTPLDWPAPGRTGWRVTEAPALGGALFQARGEVWFSADGRRFEAVENRTGGVFHAFGAALPGRAAMLAATGTGAALVEACP